MNKLGNAGIGYTTTNSTCPYCANLTLTKRDNGAVMQCVACGYLEDYRDYE